MKLPPGCDVRLGLIPEMAYLVFVAPPPLTAGMHLLEQAMRRPDDDGTLILERIYSEPNLKGFRNGLAV